MTLQLWDSRATDIDPTQKVFGCRVLLIANGDSVVFPCAGMANISIMANAGATATVRRVLDLQGTTGNAALDFVAVPANTLTTYPIDWPFILVSVAGGTAHVTIV